VATNTNRNIIGHPSTAGHHNGEYMFGCNEDSELIVGTGSNE